MPRCKVGGCKIENTVFGFPNSRRECCAAHKESGMINLKSIICDLEGCCTIPSYGFVGQKATRCKTHSENGMVNVSCKQCTFDGCIKQPAYGYEWIRKK